MMQLTKSILNLLSKGSYDKLQKENQQLKGMLRPGLGSYGAFGGSPGGANQIQQAFYLESEVEIFSDVILKIRQEIFRRGFSWKPVYACKCNLCGTEYFEETNSCTCGNMLLTKPDKSQQDRFKIGNIPVLEQANQNGQSLKEILMEYEFNLNVADNAYILVTKSYIYDAQGAIIAGIPKEILSVDPRNIQKIYDPKSGVPGGTFVCPEHRDKTGKKDERCTKCGLQLQEAFYQTTWENKNYYLKDEVKYRAKFYPSLLYGFPPCLKMEDTLWAYHYLEKRTRLYYEKGRPPGIATFPTNNLESLRKFWDETQAKLQEDPYYFPIMGYDSGQGRGNATFMKLLEDPNASMLEVKKELRERVSSRFGVSLIFQSDTSASGGLNNEGLQITVTNRAVEAGQMVYNGDPETHYRDGILSWLCQQFGITDFVLQLNPSEEQDEMAEKQRFSQDVWNAKVMFDMGFDLKFEGQKFIFSGQAVRAVAPPAFGGGGSQDESTVGNVQVSTASGAPEEAGGGSVGPKIPVGGKPAQNRSITQKGDIKNPDELDEYQGDQLIKSYASDALRAIREGALYPLYTDVGETAIPKIHYIIEDAFLSHRLNMREITAKIMELGLGETQAHMIARTETTNVANMSRQIGYEKMEEARDEKFSYIWSVAHDHRTSQQCLEIEARVGEGKSLDEIQTIIQDVAEKYIPGWMAQLVPHPNCRSQLLRKV